MEEEKEIKEHIRVLQDPAADSKAKAAKKLGKLWVHRECATFTSGCVRVRNTASQDKILELGGLQALVELLRTGSDDQKKAASSALILFTYKHAPPLTLVANKSKIRELHALKPLLEHGGLDALLKDFPSGHARTSLQDSAHPSAHATWTLESFSYKDPEIQALISTPIKAAIKGRIDEMTVDTLKDLLGCLSLKKAGRKAELIERLKTACLQVAVLFACCLWA